MESKDFGLQISDVSYHNKIEFIKKIHNPHSPIRNRITPLILTIFSYEAVGGESRFENKAHQINENGVVHGE